MNRVLQRKVELAVIDLIEQHLTHSQKALDGPGESLDWVSYETLKKGLSVAQEAVQRVRRANSGT